MRRTDTKRRILPLLVVLVLGSGCGTLKYNRAWKAFAGSGETHGLEGRWQGGWESQWNGHSGGLRCMMTRQDEAHYRGWFHSTYAFFLSFQHTTDFTVEVEDGTYRFRGEQDLGEMAGGVYRYEGTVTGDSFQATYEAENGDHGVFEMQRAGEER